MAAASGFSDRKTCRMFSLYLPEELIMAEILTRLPVESLLRCKAVSKLWHSKISSPDFIKLQLDHSTAAPKLHSLTIQPAKSKDFFGGDIVVDSICLHNLNSAYLVSHNIAYFKDKLEVLPSTKLMLVDSCNGIVFVQLLYVCLRKPVVYLWNPAIRRSHRLPDFIFPKHINTKTKPFRPPFSLIGFGFDPIASDFKVVGRLDIEDQDYIGAQVYSANRDCWRLTKVDISILPLNYCDASIKGMLYWYDKIKKHVVIFDLNKKVLKKFVSPVFGEKDDTTYNMKIVDFRDFVGMIVYKRIDGGMKEISLWSMDGEPDDGNSWTKNWSKLWDFEIFRRVKRVLTLENKSEGSVPKTEEEELILYDVDNKKVGSIRIPIPSQWRPGDILIKYVESLLSIKGFKKS